MLFALLQTFNGGINQFEIWTLLVTLDKSRSTLAVDFALRPRSGRCMYARGAQLVRSCDVFRLPLAVFVAAAGT